MLHPDLSSWANPIECHYGPLRSFVVNNSDYTSHTELTRRVTLTSAGAMPTPEPPKCSLSSASGEPRSGPSSSAAGVARHPAPPERQPAQRPNTGSLEPLMPARPTTDSAEPDQGSARPRARKRWRSQHWLKLDAPRQPFHAGVG